MSKHQPVLLPIAASLAIVGGIALCSCVQVNVTSSGSGNENAPASISGNANSNGNSESQPVNIEGNGNITGYKEATHKIERISYRYNFAETSAGWSYWLVRGTDGDILYLKKIGTGEDNDPDEFPLSHTALSKIEIICEEHGVHDWPEKLDQPDVQYADRSESYITVAYADGSTRSFSTADELPEGGEGVISDIAVVLKDIVDID